MCGTLSSSSDDKNSKEDYGKRKGRSSSEAANECDILFDCNIDELEGIVVSDKIAQVSNNNYYYIITYFWSIYELLYNEGKI